MTDIEAGMSAEDAAAKWVENNQDRVNEWLETE
jgi:glycine betaine/proline transport system substrate-binding protein